MTVSDFIKSSNLKNIDAKILLQHVAGISASTIIAHPEMELDPTISRKLIDFAEKRNSGVPIEYLVGEKSFYKDTFSVCEGVLIPQPDTETLVEEAVSIALKSSKESFRVLDLCTGTGCIGISVSNDIANHFKNFEVVFADISDIAINCCSTNAKNLLHDINYKIIQGDLFENLSNLKFDMILTNPPYIATDTIPTLESDVQHEPLLALDGGALGLDIIQKIVNQSPTHLNESGHLIMEIGYDQGEAVSSLFRQSMFKDVAVIKDLGLRARVVKGSI